jgi:hypothetical protein
VWLPLLLLASLRGAFSSSYWRSALFITPALVGGPRDLMIAVLIQQQVDLFNWPFASALAVGLRVQLAPFPTELYEHAHGCLAASMCWRFRTSVSAGVRDQASPVTTKVNSTRATEHTQRRRSYRVSQSVDHVL